MRIMYFLAHPNGLGGASKQMIIHASIMKRSGNDVCVVVQNFENGTHNSDYDRICELYGLDTCDCIYSIATCIEEIDIQDSIYMARSVAKLMTDYKPDVIHSLQINTSVEMAARALGIPHVMSIYPLSDGMFNLRWEDVFPRYVVGDSYYYSEQWGKGLGIRSKCIRVCQVSHNTQNEVFERLDYYEILSIGLLVPYKNQLEIIKFVEKISNDGLKVRLTILGDYETTYGKECLKYVRDHRIDNIKFEGFVLDVSSFIKHADVLIHASFRDSYPGVIVEAMSNRVPVIVYPTGGIPELVLDGWNGLFLSDVSSESICRAFKRFRKLQSEGTLCELVENAYETYIKNHSEEVVFSELKELYVNMIDNKDESIKDHSLDNIILSFKENSRMNSKYSMFTRRHSWYLWHIKRQINACDYKNAFIWGAGNYGQYAVEWCKYLNLEVLGFIDTIKEGKYLGYSVLGPTDEHLSLADVIFIAIANVDACRIILDKLEAMGRIRNKDFFFLKNDPCM